jgi:hypothetical protein
MGAGDDGLSHHWSLDWGVVGTAIQSLRSCPIYFDSRVRNHCNGRWMQSNCPHDIRHRGAGSDRVSLRSCWSCLVWSVSDETQEPAVPAIKIEAGTFLAATDRHRKLATICDHWIIPGLILLRS